MALGEYWAGRRGTAAGLLALNAAAGRDYYRVPREAALDDAAAHEAFAGDEVVIDVQTHFVADRPACDRWNTSLRAMYQAVAPEWWRGLDGITAYDVTRYLRCVFAESETAVAVLTSAPGLGPDRMLFNRELAGMRALVERFAGGTGSRLLNHAVVHPDIAGGLDEMERDADRFRPVGWKVYTLGQTTPGSPGWWLDDGIGRPFLERARRLGVPRVCVHKGISNLIDTGSPRDVGPAARDFPDLDVLVYHSGYELPVGEASEEGPYRETTADVGTNRLIKSLRDAAVPPGSNVYAELGTTWFCLLRRPEEAAHVVGKLLVAVGENNVLWGTDSIWYGSPQPAIDAFRAFQIPSALCQRYGYPELTAERKAKILGQNAARVYGIDLAAAREQARSGDLAWLRSVTQDIEANGLPEAR